MMLAELRLSDHITDDEQQRIFGWGEDIFGTGALTLEWRPKNWHIFVDVEGRAVTHVGVLKHTVSVGVEEVVVGGIGGVVSTPDVQGKGYAQRAMRHAASFMSDELQVEFGLLFCRDQMVPFYERLGWQLLPDAVEVEQSTGTIRIPLNVMVLPCGERTWPAGTTHLNSRPW